MNRNARCNKLACNVFIKNTIEISIRKIGIDRVSWIVEAASPSGLHRLAKVFTHHVHAAEIIRTQYDKRNQYGFSILILGKPKNRLVDRIRRSNVAKKQTIKRFATRHELLTCPMFNVLTFAGSRTHFSTVFPLTTSKHIGSWGNGQLIRSNRNGVLGIPLCDLHSKVRIKRREVRRLVPTAPILKKRFTAGNGETYRATLDPCVLHRLTEKVDKLHRSSIVGIGIGFSPVGRSKEDNINRITSSCDRYNPFCMGSSGIDTGIVGNEVIQITSGILIKSVLNSLEPSCKRFLLLSSPAVHRVRSIGHPVVPLTFPLDQKVVNVNALHQSSNERAIAGASSVCNIGLCNHGSTCYD